MIKATPKYDAPRSHGYHGPERSGIPIAPPQQSQLSNPPPPQAAPTKKRKRRPEQFGFDWRDNLTSPAAASEGNRGGNSSGGAAGPRCSSSRRSGLSPRGDAPEDGSPVVSQLRPFSDDALKTPTAVDEMKEFYGPARSTSPLRAKCVTSNGADGESDDDQVTEIPGFGTPFTRARADGAKKSEESDLATTVDAYDELAETSDRIGSTVLRSGLRMSGTQRRSKEMNSFFASGVVDSCLSEPPRRDPSRERRRLRAEARDGHKLGRDEAVRLLAMKPPSVISKLQPKGATAVKDQRPVVEVLSVDDEIPSNSLEISANKTISAASLMSTGRPQRSPPSARRLLLQDPVLQSRRPISPFLSSVATPPASLPVRKVKWGLSTYEDIGQSVLVADDGRVEFKHDHHQRWLLNPNEICGFQWYDSLESKSDSLIFVRTNTTRYPRYSNADDSQSPSLIIVQLNAPLPEVHKFLQRIHPLFNVWSCDKTPSVLTDRELAKFPNISEFISPRKNPASAPMSSSPPPPASSPDFAQCRRLTRSQTRCGKGLDADVHEEKFYYPSSGSGRVLVTVGDIARLKGGEFLNDTIIEWYLKYIQNELVERDPVLANETFVFSTFFYNRLTSKQKDGSPIAYDRVKKWTSRIDLFSKRFIFIPINESLHWYLAVIYNPARLLDPVTESEPMDDSGACSPLELTEWPPLRVTRSRRARAVSDGWPPDVVMVEEDDFAKSAPESVIDVDSDDEGKAEVNDKPPDGDDHEGLEARKMPDGQEEQAVEAEMVTGTKDEESEGQDGRTAASGSRQYPGTDRSWIIVFDSLKSKDNGSLRRIFAAYLQQEALAKRGVSLPPAALKSDRLRLTHAKVPCQTNHCDCGVYLLHYVQMFLNDPTTLLQKIVSNVEDKDAWGKSLVVKKRRELRELAEQLCEKYQTELALQRSVEEQ